MAMIRFENVTKRFRGTARPALSNVDFEVLRGEFVFLVGASGSGKSSCLRLILREETPSDGRVVVLGRDLRSLSNRKVPYFRRHVGAVFQDFRLLPNKTVFQNVAFTLQVIGSSRGFIQQAVPEVLALVGAGVLLGRARGPILIYVIYVVALVAVYAASAIYHLMPAGERLSRALRLVDHVAISFFVAASSTPLLFRALTGTPRLLMLVMIWGLAVIAALVKVLWTSAPRAASDKALIFCPAT